MALDAANIMPLPTVPAEATQDVGPTVPRRRIAIPVDQIQFEDEGEADKAAREAAITTPPAGLEEALVGTAMQEGRGHALDSKEQRDAMVAAITAQQAVSEPQVKRVVEDAIRRLREEQAQLMNEAESEHLTNKNAR
jgi:hypothetical protein